MNIRNVSKALALVFAAGVLAPCAFAASPAALFPDVPSNPFDYSRTTTFTYDALGRLLTSTSNPGAPSDCSVKTLSYDTAGNISSTQVSNCQGAAGRALFSPRTTLASTYGAYTWTSGSNVAVSVPAGLVLTQQSDATGDAAAFVEDPRFGTRTSSTLPGGRKTLSTVDDWGRVIKQTYPDGTALVQGYCLLSSTGTLDASQASNSAGCAGYAGTIASVAPGLARKMTFQQTLDTNGVIDGPLALDFFDVLGREIRKASEGFDGDNLSVSSAMSGAWTVSDTVYDANGAARLKTAPYFLSTGSTSAVSGSQDVAVTQTDVDVLDRPVSVYKTSNADAPTSVTFGTPGSMMIYGSYGTRRAAHTTWTYGVLSSTETNDKGQARTVESDPNGKALRLTDATGAQLVFQYDAFGLRLAAVDALQNTTSVLHNYRGDEVYSSDTDRGNTVRCYDAVGNLKAVQTSSMRGSDTAVACPDVSSAGMSAVSIPAWTTYAYDVMNRAVERIAPDLKTDSYFRTYSDGKTNCDAGVSTLCETTTSNGLDNLYSYDTLGRMVVERRNVSPDGLSFTHGTSYDGISGRPSVTTYPTGLQVRYAYTRRGFVEGLQLVTPASVAPLPDKNGLRAASGSLTANTMLWEATALSADGAVEAAVYANNVLEARAYEPGTGRVLGLNYALAGKPPAASSSYTWDSLGNLLSRADAVGDGIAVSESFGYDAVNRLTSYRVAGDMPGYERSVSLGYNAVGMLLSKSDIGDYAYLTQDGRHQHALTGISSGGSTKSFTYDGDGNALTATTGSWGKLTYSSFDKVMTAATPDNSVTYGWLYDANGDRVSEQRSNVSGTRKTWYFSDLGELFFESEVNAASNSWTDRHFLVVRGVPVGVLQSTGPLPSLAIGAWTPPSLSGGITLNKVEYWHADHLGSLVATTDHTGAATARYSYDPYGKRRELGGNVATPGEINVDWNPALNSGTPRGFTGHEGLDDIGLVNMNGRIFDPLSSMFVQADPHVTDPKNLQNYNRYSYVLNNPLNATDPTGFDLDPVDPNAANGTDGTSGGGTTDNGDNAAATVVVVGVALPSGWDSNFTFPTIGSAGDLVLPSEIQWGGTTPALGGATVANKASGLIATTAAAGVEEEEERDPREEAREDAQFRSDTYYRGKVEELVKRIKEMDPTYRYQRAVSFGEANIFTERDVEFLEREVSRVAQEKGIAPLNLTPEGAARAGAFNQAKRDAGVPTSQQPSRVLPNTNRRGDIQPGRVYEFQVTGTNGSTRTVRIRDDAEGHHFGFADPQNRAPHFNIEGDPLSRHYDY